MELTENQKNRIINNLVESETFRKASTSTALLLYLFDATKKQINLKESVIDLEFFNRDSSSDKTNARVRVNVHNLRKKINQYYDKEGDSDPFRVSIEKGQYYVSFKKTKNYSFFKSFERKFLPPYLLLTISLVFLILQVVPKSKPSLWKNFLSNTNNTNLYIGDHFGMTGKTITGNQGWTRDFSLNSADDYYNFINSHQQLKDSIKPANYSYVTRMGAIASQRFQQFFQNYERPIKVRFSTQTSSSEIKEGNAIYAGPSKNGNQFLYFFNQSNPNFQISASGINTKDAVSNNLVYDLGAGNQQQEYAVVSKYPVGKTEHFVFFSQHDIGVTATIEYFTNTENIAKFSSEYLKEQTYFTAIFKVQGQDRTNISLTLEHVSVF